jgi:hypothetical protein
MNRYHEESSDPKRNAQRNLSGRSHYVDDDTLRFHKSRILSARPGCDGLVFWLIESCAIDYKNTKRGFRYVIFDVFGHVVSRVELEDCFSSRDRASKAMWKWFESFDPIAHTLKAIDDAERYSREEYATMRRDLCDIKVAA